MSEDLQGNNLHNEIVRRHCSGSSMRSIARSLGISRYQVRRILAAYREGREQGTNPLPEPKKTRASRLDEYQPLQQLLERYPDITAVRMHEELQKLGFTGSYSIVKRRLRQLRPRKSRDFVQRFETGPGLQAQMDYSTYTIDFAGEGRRRVHLFSYLLGYSRRQYLHFVDSPRLHDDDSPTRRGFPILGRRRRHLSLRQHESRGQRIRRRGTGLQHSLSGIRHTLWLSPPCVPPSAQSDEGLRCMLHLFRIIGRKVPMRRGSDSFRPWHFTGFCSPRGSYR